MNTGMVRSLVVLVMSLVLVVAVGGCRGGDDTPINPDLADSESRSSTTERTIARESLPEFDSEWLFESASGLKPIYFDFDSYDLRADSLATLRENAEKLKKVSGVILQIEGHCDERGTQEYNLALGERRSLAARAHLIMLGVSGDRIITISYGEEDPASSGHDETAWSKNRRCAFNKAM